MTTAFNLIHFSNDVLPNPGDIITYYLGVSNAGQSPINSVLISSNLSLTYSGINEAGPTPGSSFNVGDINQNGLIDQEETWYYQALYTVTPQDISNNGGSDGVADGALTNTVTVSANGPGGPLSRISSASVPLVQKRPGLTVSQVGSPNPAKLGDRVDYAIAVQNTGNVTFFSLDLTTSPFGPPRAVTGAGGFNIGDGDADGNLDVGETWRYIASYQVSQQDLNNNGAFDGKADGALTNTVTAKASACDGDCGDVVTASNSTSVPLQGGSTPVAGVLLVKTARLGDGDCLCPDPCPSGSFGVGNDTNPALAGIQASAGVNLGNLAKYLFVFADGSVDANWQGATKGFAGDVVVDGLQARERTSGGVPFAGTLYTNDSTGGAWQSIVTTNAGQASLVTGQTSLVSGLEKDLVTAIQDINALAPTATASFAGRSYNFANLSSSALNGLNTTDGIGQTFVINVTSGLQVSQKINISGDANDVFVLRWDTDANPGNGYQGQVKFQSGGAIVPNGGLKLGNFIHVAGDINSSGGGSNPAVPFPQGPVNEDGTLIQGGKNFSGGGFFTGYWLTTGAPSSTPDPLTGLYTGPTSSLSNGIFAGGWYSLTTKFSMTSGTSGVHVCPDASLISPAPPSQQTDPLFNPGNVGYDSAVLSGRAKDLVTYTFRVTNSGQTALANPNLIDNNATPTNPSDDYVPTGVLKANGRNFGDLNDNNLIDVGESWFYQSKRYLGSGPATLTNTATVTTSPLGGGTPLTSSDSAIVQIVPSLPGMG